MATGAHSCGQHALHAAAMNSTMLQPCSRAAAAAAWPSPRVALALPAPQPCRRLGTASSSSGAASSSSRAPAQSLLRRLSSARAPSRAAPDAVSNPSGAPEGQVSAELMAAMEAKIADALEAQRVVVSDVYGDGRHVAIDVVSAAFDGKTSVQRQRMVYKAIWLELQEAVHAVDAMSTKTPDEAAA